MRPPILPRSSGRLKCSPVNRARVLLRETGAAAGDDETHAHQQEAPFLWGYPMGYPLCAQESCGLAQYGPDYRSFDRFRRAGMRIPPMWHQGWQGVAIGLIRRRRGGHPAPVGAGVLGHLMILKPSDFAFIVFRP